MIINIDQYPYQDGFGPKKSDRKVNPISTTNQKIRPNPNLNPPSSNSIVSQLKI